MTGAQIIEALNQQYDEDQAYYLQISGLHYTYTDQNDPNQPYKVVQVYDQHNQPLDMNKTYNVVINDFLAGGGDGFSAFKGTKVVGIVGQDTDAFIDYITDMTNDGKPITAPIMNRKIYLTAEQVAKADADTQSQTGTNQNTQNVANSQTEGNQLQKVPSQPVSPTVTLPTTAGQPVETVTLHAQPKQQTVAAANNQLINLTPTSINGQKQKAANQQAALPQTGNDEDLALLLLGNSLMAATGLTIIDRKRKHA